MILLIIGSRFGGAAIPKAVDTVDVDRIRSLSTATAFADDKNKLSVTQIEILKAIESSIPIFTFIDSGVLHDHLTYERNRNKPILSEIEFPHIDKQATAPYIFEFINFLRFRAENNSIIGFTKLEEIEGHLKKQWSGLFQRLLYEQRLKQLDERRIDFLASQIADIKTAVMTSITRDDLKATAKGAIKFRPLIDFISSLSDGLVDVHGLLRSEMSWEEVLAAFDIREIRAGDTSRKFMHRTILLRGDGTYYWSRFSPDAVNRMGMRWHEFRQMPEEARHAIINAVLDNADPRPYHWVRYVPEQFGAADDQESEAGDSPDLEP